MKKIFALMIFVLIAGNVFAERLPKEVLEIAREKIPEETEFKKFNHKNNEYKLYFVDNEKSTYKVEVDQIGTAFTVKEVEFETKKNPFCKEAQIELETEDIEALIKEKYSDATRIKVELNYQGFQCKYEVEFRTAEFKAEFDINPSTGDICKQEFEYYFDVDSIKSN